MQFFAISPREVNLCRIEQYETELTQSRDIIIIGHLMKIT